MSNSDKDRLIELCFDTIWRADDELLYSIYIENIQSMLLKIPRIKKYIEEWDSSVGISNL